MTNRRRRRRSQRQLPICLICHMRCQEPALCATGLHFTHAECLRQWHTTADPTHHHFRACPICPEATALENPIPWKPCPNCGIGIEKNGGCDDIFCVWCGTLFNWVTADIYSLAYDPPLPLPARPFTQHPLFMSWKMVLAVIVCSLWLPLILSLIMTPPPQVSSMTRETYQTALEEEVRLKMELAQLQALIYEYGPSPKIMNIGWITVFAMLHYVLIFLLYDHLFWLPERVDHHDWYVMCLALITSFCSLFLHFRFTQVSAVALK